MRYLLTATLVGLFAVRTANAQICHSPAARPLAGSAQHAFEDIARALSARDVEGALAAMTTDLVLSYAGIGLHPATPEFPAGRQGSMAIGLYLTEPIERAVETFKERGVSFMGPIVDDKALSLAFFADPDGNPMYLAEMKPAYR